jgi:hypothetical protein
MRLTLSLFFPLSLLSLASLASAACAGQTENPCSGPACSSSDLTGTWDLIATSPAGQPQSGTMILTHDTLTLDFGSTQLSIDASTASPGVTWTHDGRGGTIVTRLTPTAMSLGVVPLDVGGDWTFTSTGDAQRCVASLSPSAWSGYCDSYVYDWPSEVTEPVPGVHYTATRTQQLDSVFGDLGGTWTATDGRGGPGTCTVTFQGSSFSSTCSGGAGALDGSVSLTFDGTSSASGTTNHGYELSAHKQ